MKRNVTNDECKTKFLFKISLCFALLLIVFLLPKFSNKVLAANENYCYLSDISYTKDQSSVGWGSITLDKNLDSGVNGGLIALQVDGQKKRFLKGISAHATSTVVYNITDYDYEYFTAYIGVDQGRGSNGNGVKFLIYTSVDGTNWDLRTPASPKVMKGNTNAEFVKIDIRDANYIKLYAHNNGNNDSDHAVYADAKLINEGYTEDTYQVDFIKTLAEYDEIIKANEGKEITGEYELTLLQRELVNNADYEILKLYGELNQENNETLRWLMTDLENLRLYVLGGKPDGGSYYSSLKELTRLYNQYKEDFKDTTPTNNKWYPNLTKGQVYKKMAISLSLTHSTAVGYWAQINHPSNRSDALERYRIFKYLYDNGQFVVSSRQDHTPWFEALQVEEMRYIMNSIIDDEEIIWLNEYTQKRIDAHPNQEEKYLQPHTYIAYVWPNFQNPIFHDPDKKDYWDEKFEGIFSKYGVTYSSPGDMVYKAWMSMRNEYGTGAVCGGISKLGTHIRAAHGTPASVISQPGHAAIIYYRKNADGKGYWTIDNDVSGWAKSGKTEKLGTRMPLGWGNDRYVSGYAATYIALSQEALNDNENYEKSEKLIMLANSYSDTADKERILREALSVQNINIDAWWGLINLYKADSTKTQEDYYNLAAEMGEALKPFPLPMYNLLNQIKGQFVDTEYQFKYSLLETRLLTEGKSFNDTSKVLQPGITRTVASYLLGLVDTNLANFSFDGEDAGKIVLSNRFDGNGIRWDYCIDGKPKEGLEHWTEVSFNGDEEHKLQLTPEEIASITAENDIYVHIVGVNYSDDNLYKIDILPSQGLPSTIYANDWENKLLEATPTIKWKLNENDPWKLWGDEQPDLTGDKTLTVKVAATGVYEEQKNSQTFNFTTNTDPDTRKYISIDHIGLHAFSTEASGQGRYARYAIDGNLNTSWHSNWSGNDPDKFIVFKFDEVKNLTALEYFPAPGGNGKILSAQILVSLDGENWTEVVSGTNWTYSNTNDVSTKTVDFDPVKAQYVKVVGKRTQNSYITAKMFNLYENTTIRIVGTFSFDGDNAKKIMIDDDLKGQSWQYSLDGGNTWKNGSGDEHQLTNEEVEQITAQNQIKMRFGDSQTVYTIRINKMDTPIISGAYLNDWENRLIGVNDTTKNNLEWQIEGTDTWTDYTEKEPVVEGAKKLYIRTKAKGNFTASDNVEFQFNQDNNTPKQQYIPIKHLAVEGYTSQSKDTGRPYYAPNAIDGNANTIWHSTFDQNLTGKKSFYTIKLDSTKYISALEFMQKKYRDNDPCFIKNMYVYVSDNNQDWIELGRLENIPQIDNELRRIDFAEDMPGQYVKIEMETYGMFTSLSMVNLYENTTITKAGSFSFDGEEANKIILEDNFKGNAWEYSLDGGETWKQASGDEQQLTKEEVEQVNGDDKIKLRINNVEYLINIQKSATPNITAYLNDLENRLIGMGNVDGLEWKIESETHPSNEWKEYAKEEPVVEGDSKLIIRQKARNVFAASETLEFNFTADNQPDTRKYIPVSQLSVGGFSAEDKSQNGAAANALDGNYNTRWLNSSAGTDQQKYIIVKLDTASYVTAMDYVPHSENGKILGGTIEGSMDGENFTEIATISGWANNQDTKTIDFETPVKVRYIKITGTNTSYTNAAKRHLGARMFNFYEDTTKRDGVAPTAEVVYNTTNLTNQNVVATLVNPSTEITILNNDGNASYIFTENGEFTFEFEDSEGNKGTAVATVDWICKTLPNATFTYDITDLTNKDVTVTVTFDREGTVVTNNNGSNQYTFTDNGDFTFEFRGPYGNEGSATASVDWICKTLPNATFTYDITESTNQDVTVTVTFDREGTVVTNNNGSNQHTFTENGDFTFEFRGPYGNEGSATAHVDWIDKTIPRANITYSTTNKTNQDVVATLETDENITITNNGGNNTFTFTENGSFTFEFENELGNRGTAVANVNWIDKRVPEASISYNITEATNQEVIATVSFDEENVRITNNEGRNTYTFTENEEFTFEYADEAGNEGTILAKVTWIDKTLPVATISYNITSKTNQNVVATVTFDKENVVVTGGNTHTFTENGEYKFEFVGPAGNRGVAIAKVTWIDKKRPEPTVIYTTINPTNQDVTAQVVFDKENVTITNNDQKNTYTFTENGEFTFKYQDEAGNTGSVVAIVNWIDKRVPIASISYNITDPTNQDVVATITFDKEDVTVEEGETHTFTENGKYEFKYVDNAGNKGTAIANVDWIDKKAPTAVVVYNITHITDQDVIAKLVNFSEEVTITNNDGKDTYTFTEDGTFTFEFVDKVGNKGTAVAKVSWIEKEEEFIFQSSKYQIVEKDSTISNIRPGIEYENETTIKEFKENITTNQELEFLREDGTVLGDDEVVVTGMKLKVGEKREYTLIVKGDIDKDGNITINDLAKMKLHIIEKELLAEDVLKAADIDNDDEITINDLAVLKLMLIGMETID